jgi:hypothetical protein
MKPFAEYAASNILHRNLMILSGALPACHTTCKWIPKSGPAARPGETSLAAGTSGAVLRCFDLSDTVALERAPKEGSALPLHSSTLGQRVGSIGRERHSTVPLDTTSHNTAQSNSNSSFWVDAVIAMITTLGFHLSRLPPERQQPPRPIATACRFPLRS